MIEAHTRQGVLIVYMAKISETLEEKGHISAIKIEDEVAAAFVSFFAGFSWRHCVPLKDKFVATYNISCFKNSKIPKKSAKNAF